MKLQSFVFSTLNHSLVSTKTLQKAESTRTQVTQLTTDVAAKSAKAGRAGFSSLASDTTGGLFGVMMEYQKMMNKEAREDRKIARMDAELGLMGKESKLELEKNKIAEMRDEAAQRFGHGMATADIMTVVGHVMRESYLQDTEDLKSYADKVKNFNTMKKQVREDLHSAQIGEGVLTDRLKSSQGDENIMETLFTVLKESIKENNETKKLKLHQLSLRTTFSAFMSKQMEAIAAASQALAKLEKKDDDD